MMFPNLSQSDTLNKVCERASETYSTSQRLQTPVSAGGREEVART